MTAHLRWATAVAALAAAAVSLACAGREPSTPEAKKARGEELIGKMSAQLAAAKSLSFTAVQTREEMRGQERVKRIRTVHYAVTRPDKAHLTFQPQDGASSDVWYDGSRLTIVSHKEKYWARGPMPNTLDAALDAMATEYAIPTPVADLLYSSPRDAFVQTGSTGGWVAREAINGQMCERLSYQSPVVDWDLWIAEGERALPCQLKITYKQDPGAPTMTAVLKDWDLAASHGADEFIAKVDEQAYRRITLVRAPTAEPEPVKTTGAEVAPAKP